MSAIKHELEELSVELGIQGEITDEVCAIATYIQNRENIQSYPTPYQVSEMA